MEPTTNPAPKQRRSAVLVSAGLLAGGAAAGALLVGVASAAAADPSQTAATSESSSVQGQSGEGRDGAGRHPGDGSSTPVRGDEKAVSSDVAAKLRAAALKAVPGGTVTRVETDAGDAAYEAHMTKADGTRATVKFDEDYAVTAVQDGMGMGDPRSGGHPRDGERPSSGGRSGEGTGA